MSHKGTKRTERLSPVVLAQIVAQFGSKKNAHRRLNMADAGVAFIDFVEMSKRFYDPIKVKVVEQLWSTYKKDHNIPDVDLPEDAPRPTRPMESYGSKRKADVVILELNKRHRPFKFTEE